jgi:phosphoribosyl 1,2-cyclic phosphate phosphodiesterase
MTGAPAIRPKRATAAAAFRSSSSIANHHPGRYQPRLRIQLLDAGVVDLSAVIWTHDHADHCHGIDDLRQILHSVGRPIDGFARPVTLDTLLSRFGYASRATTAIRDSMRPCARRSNDDRWCRRADRRPASRQHHLGRIRFEADGRSIAYSTDFNSLTDEMISLFEGVDCGSSTHCAKATSDAPALEQALAWIERIHPRQAI